MPDRIRTYDLLLRKQTLYPAELRAHTTIFMVYFKTFRVLRYMWMLISYKKHPPRNEMSITQKVTGLLYHIFKIFDILFFRPVFAFISTSFLKVFKEVPMSAETVFPSYWVFKDGIFNRG